MKKPAVIVGTLAAAGVLLAGTPASASTGTASTTSGGLSTSSSPQQQNVDRKAAVGFVVNNARCTATSVRFTAKTYENGVSGVSQFKQQAQLQKFTTAGWVTAGPIKTVPSKRFPNDARNFSFTLNWTGTHPANGGSWREAWKGLYLNSAGRVIASTKVIYVTCR